MRSYDRNTKASLHRNSNAIEAATNDYYNFIRRNRRTLLINLDYHYTVKDSR